MKGRLLAVAGVGAMVGVLLLGVQLHRLRTGPDLRAGTVSLAGPGAPVEILWDSLGVPHVWAGSEEDLFFGQGFVHASDRLWQMELFRRVARGRLSEIFGERALDSDRFLRTLGLARAAERTLGTLDARTRRLLEAYARGVNAAVGRWEGPRPPEMVVLGVEFEPWTVGDALAVEMIMAWDLADYGRGLTLAQARRSLGAESFEVVRPRYPDWGVTILPDSAGDGVAGEPERNDADSLPAEALLEAARPPALAARLLESASTVRASNAWVVGGRRSASGKPVLANDMHLGLDAPTLWYLAALHAPGLHVAGMTIPGTPGVVAGHTRGVAWGFSNAGVDDSDFFVERVDPADSTRYLTPEGSRPFEVREERIPVRGRDEPVTVRVRETRHGPVMTPVEARAGEELLAYRWVAHEPSTTPRAMLAMNRAGTAEAFLEALAGFRNPHQNVVFADTAGSWGYWLAGRIPLRRSGGARDLPAPGWTGEHDWTGFLPFEEHPHALRPATGFVVTANNRQTRGPVSELVSAGGWAPPYRAMRITELVRERELHDAESMRRLQLDVTSAFVLRHRDAAVRAFDAAGLAGEARALRAWDGSATLESREATLFHAWIEGVERGLRRSLYGGPSGFLPYHVVDRTLEEGAFGLDTLGPRMARTAVVEADGQPWGEAHQLHLEHPLGELPVVGALLGFGRTGIPREGGPHTVNVAGFAGGPPPYRVRWGPSQRHVVDMADVDGSGGFILPGGQSGFPAGPRSWDQLERWRRGELWRIPLGRAAAEGRAVARLRLEPEKPPDG